MVGVPPILIAAPTRCGTTMIAGLLYHHGVWIGEAKVTAYPETNSLLGTENSEIKAFLKSWRGKDNPAEFRRKVRSYVGTEGPWLLKTVLILSSVKDFLAAFPDATWILPYRPFEDIVASQMRHPGMPGKREVRGRRVEHGQRKQDEVAEKANRVLRVDAHAMALGDEKVARELVEFCGLEFDPDIWREWIKPEMWHSETEAHAPVAHTD